MPPPPAAVAEATYATRLALLMVAGFVFIILGLAGAHFFRRPCVGQGVRFRLHQGASIFFAVVHLAAIAMLPELELVPVMAAIVLYASGLCLFLWAQDTIKRQPPFLAFSDVAPNDLFVSGPYAIVRHPCYFAFILVWLAGAIGTLNVWVAASALLMIGSYLAAARDEEHAFERSRFAGDYRIYAARTGKLLPKPRQLAHWPLQTSLGVVLAIVTAIALTAALVYDLVWRPFH